MKPNSLALRQQGVALITVMVILLLSIIAVLAAARSGLLNEAFVGNDSDYNRALAAAESLLRDAETDIRGRLPNGYRCRPNPPHTLGVFSGSDESLATYSGCRQAGVAGTPWFPADVPDMVEVAAIVGAGNPPCLQGICVPSSLTTLSAASPTLTIEGNLPTTAPLGVRYGTYTRDGQAVLTGSMAISPILRPPYPVATDAPNQGWYWVEVFTYDVDFAMGAPPLETLPSSESPFIYRITAVALGQKTGTRAVLKSFFVPNPRGQGK